MFGCAVKDGVEHPATFDELGSAGHGWPGGFVTVDFGEPPLGGGQPTVENTPFVALLGRFGGGAEAGPVDVAAGPPAGDVGDGGIPAGLADGVGGSWSDELVEPIGLPTGEQGSPGR